MSKKRRNSRRQYEYVAGPKQQLVVAGPSDGQERVPDMTEREASAILGQALLLRRTAGGHVSPTKDTKGYARGYVVLLRRDDGHKFMVGSVQQWPEVRRSLADPAILLP